MATDLVDKSKIAATANVAFGDKVSNLSLQTGAGLLLSISVTYVMAAIWLIAGQSLEPIASRALLIGGMLISISLPILYAPRTGLSAAVLTILLYFASVLLSSQLYDTSIDGQHYHFQAIYALASGWNPFHGSYQMPAELAPLPAIPWVIYYPKASWIVAAVQLSSGLSFEATKAENFIMFFASFFSLAGALLRLKLSFLLSSIAALAGAANAVALAQLFTHMNDGLLGESILLFITFAVLWLALRDSRALIGACAAMIFALNLKFSAAPIFLGLCAFVCVAWIIQCGAKAGLRALLVLGLVYMAAIAILGYAPYVTNLLAYGHPLYPLMGPNSIDLIGSNMPEVLRPMSGIQRFLFSLFSETNSGYGYGNVPHLKVPFWIVPGEIRHSGGIDVRLAGFGPLFSGAITIALISLLAVLTAQKRAPMVSSILLVGAAVSVLVLLFPENWWARYVPQLWIVPAAIGIAAALTTSPYIVWAGWAIILVLLVDSTIVMGATAKLGAQRHVAVTEQIRQMRNEGGRPCVFFDLAQSRIVLFRQAALVITPLANPADATCSKLQPLAGYGPDRVGGQICRCESRDN
jgi:hypothetical protein